MDATKVLEIITTECRDLLEGVSCFPRWAARGGEAATDSYTTQRICDVNAPGDRNQIVRDHLAGNLDLTTYSIPVEEWLDGVSSADRERIVNEVLSRPEYN